MPIATRDPKGQVNLRLPLSLRRQLAEFTKLTGQHQSVAATEALSEYLSWRLPQIKALKKGAAEARAGKFATAQEVEAVLARYAR